MAVKGAQAKEIIARKILETFEGAFINDKEIRIPVTEDGVQVQIKVALTCAKTNVDPNGGDILAAAAPSSEKIDFEKMDAQTIAEATKPTQEEKDNIINLMKALGL